MLSAELSPEMQAQFRSAATPVFKAKGAILFRAGEQGQGVFLIRTGRVTLKMEGCEKVYPTQILKSGAVIGLPATLSGEPYSLTAETTEDSHLDFIPQQKLLNLLSSSPELACRILCLLSEEVLQLRKTIKSAKGRSKKKRR